MAMQLGQLTDQRVQYRSRRTVLEMLKDRGYEIAVDSIDETFEEFEERQAAMKNLHMIVKRPINDRTTLAVQGEDGQPAQMKEPLFVAFAPDEKIGTEALKSLLNYMDTWSKQNTDLACTELLNCILVVKGDASQILRKVCTKYKLIHVVCLYQSLKSYAPYCFEVFKQEELLVNITHHELVPRHMVLTDS